MHNIIVHNSNFVNTPEPVIGMPATQYFISDSHAFFVSKILSKRRIVLQKATVKRTDTNGQISLFYLK